MFLVTASFLVIHVEFIRGQNLTTEPQVAQNASSPGPPRRTMGLEEKISLDLAPVKPAKTHNATKHSENIWYNPWLVKILSDSGFQLHTGGLITWEKVITTCTAAINEQITFVEAGFSEKTPQRREISTSYVDTRCNKASGRYNIGLVLASIPFSASPSVQVLQLPTLNKRRYLELTDRLVSAGGRCHFYRWKNSGELFKSTITTAESYSVETCLSYEGYHEFICSKSSDFDEDESDAMDGAPIICGDDFYGVLPDMYDPTPMATDNNWHAHIWLRIDEFLEFIIDEEIELIKFSRTVRV